VLPEVSENDGCSALNWASNAWQQWFYKKIKNKKKIKIKKLLHRTHRPLTE
jgi:hypothetical protein